MTPTEFVNSVLTCGQLHGVIPLDVRPEDVERWSKDVEELLRRWSLRLPDKYGNGTRASGEG